MANNVTVTNQSKILHKGVDISKHNGNINWDIVNKDEIDFVIIRAGYGFSTVDIKFEYNIKGAISKGLDIGIYWFSYAHNEADAEKEANFCLKLIEPYKQYITYPVWFDWEYDSDTYVRKQYGIVTDKWTVSAMAKKFMETIKAAGYKTGNYSNIDYLTRYYTDDIKENYDLWLAHVWDAKGNPREHSSYKGKYTIHQYSWVGQPTGFTTKTDMNYAYFDYVPAPEPEPVIEDKPKTYQVPKGIKFYKDPSLNVISVYPFRTFKKLRVSDHFQVNEFASYKTTNTLYDDNVRIHNKLIVILEALYKELNCSKIIVNSGYRTPEHDKSVGGSGTGYHTKGRAADVTCYDKKGNIIPAQTVCITLENMGGIYGIGYISKSSVHVDTRPEKSKWYGDETVKGAPNISKLGYNSFAEYFAKKK